MMTGSFIFFNLIMYAIGLFVLYLVIKTAVREGILEADRRRFGNNIHDTRPNAKAVACPSCKHEYHKDCGRCPECFYEESQFNENQK